MKYILHQSDAFHFMLGQADESVDCIITDPPYESLEKHRAKGTTTRLKQSKASSNEWFPIMKNDAFPRLFEEYYRILKPDRHFYMFCDQETMFIAKPLAEKAGFKFWKPLVWDKMRIGMGYHYRARYEFVLFFEKGKRKLRDLGIADILTAPRIRGGYPTEKPYALSEILIRQSTLPGETVMDTFCGSGSSGAAALLNDRDFIGCDIQSTAVAHTRARLEVIANQGVKYVY